MPGSWPRARRGCARRGQAQLGQKSPIQYRRRSGGRRASDLVEEGVRTFPDGRYAAVVRQGARSISSSSRNRGRQRSLYRPSGKAKLITCPIAMRPRLYRPAREEIARVASLEVTSARNKIVRPGKPHCLLCDISYRNLIVPPGKRYRPCEETLSSCPGTNIVLLRNLYRPLREPISSHWGKIIVLLRKYT